jgi:hypothetical protein
MPTTLQPTSAPLYIHRKPNSLSFLLVQALDKASKQELSSLSSRLLLLTESTVARDEYTHALTALTGAMADTTAERRRHLRDVAHQLQVLVAAVSSKANKSDVMAMAQVLQSVPAVSAELEQVKQFVSSAVSSTQQRTEKWVSGVMSDSQKQWKVQVKRLITRLKAEIAALESGGANAANSAGAGAGAEAKHRCDTCAVRLGTSGGPTCLSCATKLRPTTTSAPSTSTTGAGAGVGAGAGAGAGGYVPEWASGAAERELVPARGGGFSLAPPKRTTLQPDPKYAPLCSANLLCLLL